MDCEIEEHLKNSPVDPALLQDLDVPEGWDITNILENLRIRDEENYVFEDGAWRYLGPTTEREVPERIVSFFVAQSRSCIYQSIG